MTTTLSGLPDETIQNLFLHLPIKEALALGTTEKKIHNLLNGILNQVAEGLQSTQEGSLYALMLFKYDLSEAEVEQLRLFLCQAGLDLKSGQDVLRYLSQKELPKEELAAIEKHINDVCLKYNALTLDVCRQLRISLIKLHRFDLLRMFVDQRESEELSDEQVFAEMNIKPSPVNQAIMAGKDRKTIIKLMNSSSYEDLNHRFMHRTLLHAAVLNSDMEMLTLLLKRGVCVNKKSAMGLNPLNEAISGVARGAFAGVSAMLGINGEEIVDTKKALITTLVHYGAEVDTLSAAGDTPLCYAAQMGDLELVRLLLSLGADPKFLNGFGMSATQMALTNYHRDVAAYIISFMQGKVNKQETIGEIYQKTVTKR